MMNIGTLLLVLFALLSIGCASVKEVVTFEDVKPWERNILAQESMQLVPDVMESYSDDHIYFSKEASTGGKGVGGGGCGCN